LTSLIFKGLSIKSSKIEHQGKCLGVEQIYQLIKELQNIYQDNGSSCLGITCCFVLSLKRSFKDFLSSNCCLSCACFL
jgi:hypothetical protein